jgi:hypothetical protein
VAPRFVAVGDDASPGGDAYELVHEDGEPAGAGGVLLVAFLAEADAAAWEPLRALLAPRQGYLGTRRYRGGDGSVALVRWSSPLMYARALREPEIGAAAAGLRAALYLPI